MNAHSLHFPGRSLSVVHMTRSANDIPVITDPLGRSWRNPQGVHEATMDGSYVWLTQAQADDLHEYSSSYPSGVYDGKCWKRDDGAGGYWLCWYYDDGTPGKCAIGYRSIIVKESRNA